MRVSILMEDLILKEIIEYIERNNTNKRSLIIGIDGSTGAGKSTFVENINKNLIAMNFKVQVLHIDDFIHKRNIRYDDLKEQWYCFYYLQWRYDYLRNQVLEPIKNGQEINKLIEIYDKERDEYNLEELIVNKGTVVLLEGVFLQKKEIASFLDYIIFLDVPREERLKRVVGRDTYIGAKEEIENKYRTRYFPAEDKYLREYNPKDRAHFVYVNY